MIAALALELLLIELAGWQFVVLRRSLRADREKRAREGDDTGEP